MIDRIDNHAGKVRRMAGAGRTVLRPLVVLLGAFWLVAAGSSQVQAQDMRLQVQRLQQELKTLQQHVYGGGGSATTSSSTAGSAAAGGVDRPLAARLELRINQLEGEMRGLTGQVEQVGYRIDQVSRRLEQIAADLNARLERLEQQQMAPAADQMPMASMTPPAGQVGAQQGAPAAGNQLAPGETGPKTLGSVATTSLDALRQQAEQQAAQNQGQAATQAPTTLGAASQAATATQTAAATPGQGFATPKAQYDNAFTLLSQANYPAAEQALGDFISQHPQDPLAGNAMYWLGETHYVRGQYREAAVTFAEGYQNYPNSAKAPDNLLKLGKSLSALGQNQDACGTLSELLRRYPKAPANVLQQAQREQQKLSCPQ